MYAKQERYTVSETKTKVMIFNQKSVDSKIKFSLNGSTLEQVNICMHLGITRQSSNRSSNDIGVGRFRILGGGGPRGTKSPSRHMTS